MDSNIKNIVEIVLEVSKQVQAKYDLELELVNDELAEVQGQKDRQAKTIQELMEKLEAADKRADNAILESVDAGAVAKQKEEIRLTQDEEIHRLKADLEKTWEEKETLQVKHDNCVRNWREASKEIDRLTAKVKTLDEENDRLFNENSDLRGKLEDAEAKIKELNEALETNQETEPKPSACPFCGGRPDVVAINKERWVVACHSDTCAVNPETDSFDTIEEAVSAWNHRVCGLACDWR